MHTDYERGFHVYHDKLSDQERDGAMEVENGYRGLTSLIDDFEACISLLETARDGENRRRAERVDPFNRESKILGRWPFIAAREGAMIIMHFSHTLSGITAGLNQCKPLKDAIDFPQYRRVRKSLPREFPDFEAIRNAAAHHAEADVEKDGAEGPFLGFGFDIGNVKKFLIVNSLMGRRYVSTHNGQVVSYELSQASLKKLVRIRNEVCDILAPGVEILNQFAMPGYKPQNPPPNHG